MWNGARNEVIIKLDTINPMSLPVVYQNFDISQWTWEKKASCLQVYKYKINTKQLFKKHKYISVLSEKT